MKLSLAVFALLSITSTAFAGTRSMPTSDKIILNCTAYENLGDGPMQVELTRKIVNDGTGDRFEGSEVAFHKKFKFVYSGLVLKISHTENGVTVSTQGTDLDNRSMGSDDAMTPGVYLEVGSEKKSEAVNCFGFKQ